MHTAAELEATDFEYRSDGDVVSRDEVLPTITPAERVGVVMDDGTDGLGAGNLILSCITAFYDSLRETKDDFFEYPDYYTFQTTADPADYGMLDIYPEHKNVTVQPDAEHVLRAVNDRAISILLVPEGPTRSPDVEDITRRSAERRIDRCFLYAPGGRPDRPDFAIRQPREPAVEWYETTARSTESSPERDALPSFGSSDGYITQYFRTISLEGALSRLPPRR